METVYKVKTKTITLNSFTEKIRIVFFGDIHRFTRSCDEERWKWFLKKAKEQHTPNTYYLGLGDYTDFASAKEQKILLNSGLHGGTIEDLHDTVKKKNRALSMEMSFMKPNILGLIDGNHNWIFANGQTGTEDLAERLDTEYLGWLCHYTILVKINTKVQSVHIAACHGKAGGTTRGATVNQVNSLWNVFPVADIYAMGHDHQRYAMPSSVLVPSFSKGEVTLKQKRQYFVRSGSFKKAYMPDASGYEVGRLLRPADLGSTVLELSFHRDKSDDQDRIITDIVGIV